MEDISEQGIRAFIRAVVLRGGKAERLTTSRRNPVRVWGVDGKECVVRVRSKAAGDWKARRQDESLESDDTGSSYWVFVDLAVPEPEFFMVSSPEMAADIKGEVDLWMQDSPLRTRTGHHAIGLGRVQHGRNRWAVLGVNDAADPSLLASADDAASRVPQRVARKRPVKVAAIDDEVVDPRVRVVADFDGYRLNGRFDRTSHRLEIVQGPMQGRRFEDPDAAASAVASHISGDAVVCDGWTFWELESPGRAPLGSIR
ncbi:hypothetical protein [Rhodococcoides kyotonense]|uniref:Uncharacterized protein n=1 Tax=Rhodococcoides kyotonense TaxID=398843 RepID=A0A239GUA7_9NOCA|nr:hypothetical protein [Rhodococcus kyotonensis]SNS72432.1 hypothetical protein SAMN05421642_104396 [Rhodococcus kyotonensis]